MAIFNSYVSLPDGQSMEYNPIASNIKHTLWNHGLIGNFHIIGTFWGMVNIRGMGLQV